jgi:Vitamin K-dependent gamma-carboxylase
MNPLRAWNRFWFGPISARPLGAFRIVFGVLVLAHLAFISVELDYWYTSAGLLLGDQARQAARPLRYSPLHWVQDPVSVRCFVAVVAAVAVAFVLGWRTRIMGVLLYVGLLSLYHRNISTNCGPDQLMMITAFYMMLSPCGKAFSLDARRASQGRGTMAEPLIVPWAQRLLQIQLCLIYLATAAFKCHGSTWLGGTAIHFIIFNHEVGQLNLEWLAGYPIVISLLSQSTPIVELALAFLLWFRPTRKWIACAGVLLHLGVVPLVNVPLFGEQMTALYLVFLAPDELAAVLGFFDPRRWFSRRSKELRALGGRFHPAGSFYGWRQLELAFDTADTNSQVNGAH